ncbi:MAG: ATP-binding protein [Atopobiaceae bacterium]|nr:ATP-binding protein [Atopobiaceae bacterium]
MDAIILEKLSGFRLEDYEPIHTRSLDLGEPLIPRVGNLVKVVVGMRRSGKSYRLFQEIRTLLDSGVPMDQICYFNFEDDRLTPVTSRTGDQVIEAFELLHRGALARGVYLFFDEIQEMNNWGPWLRRVVDTTRATIYVTGSSSQMLSREISTEFRGRAIDFELLPFSFAEHVAAFMPGVNAACPSMEERVALQREVAMYLAAGGFPATHGLPRAQAVALLQAYAERVVSRDVVERHDVGRPRVAAALARRILATNAMPFSARRVEGDLRAAGLGTSRETIGDLMAYFEEAYLVFFVREFSYSLAEATTSMPKVYAIDPGLALASARANSNALGQRLEDAVYLELRRRTGLGRADSVCSYRTKAGGFEVDFVVGDALMGDLFELCQVSADVSDERTLSRELRALWQGMREAGAEESLLVTLEGDEVYHERDGMRVRQVPAWRWLLDA